MEPRQNPYKDPSTGLWYWFDETGAPCEKGHASQRLALRELLDYLDYLDTGRIPWRYRWRQFCQLWLQLWRA